MKKLTVLLFATALIFTACKNEPSPSNGRWDPDALVSIRPGAGVKSSNPEHLTAIEIVKRATDIWFMNEKINGNTHIGRAFSPAQRDTINVRLMMWGTDIIGQFGTYEPDFIEGKNFILTREWANFKGMDTIGYIPNKVMRAAEAQVKEALAQQDTTAVYEIFDKAFTFYPITAKEYEALKAKGEN